MHTVPTLKPNNHKAVFNILIIHAASTFLQSLLHISFKSLQLSQQILITLCIREYLQLKAPQLTENMISKSGMLCSQTGSRSLVNSEKAPYLKYGQEITTQSCQILKSILQLHFQSSNVRGDNCNYFVIEFLKLQLLILYYLPLLFQSTNCTERINI